MTADATARTIKDDETTLPLSGAGPFELWVKVDDHGIPLFATSATAAEYTEIGWQPAEEVSSAQFTFHFHGHNPISNLTSQNAGLTFNTVSGNSQVGTCSAREGEYNFTVVYTKEHGGELLKVDPIIIVTIPPRPELG